MKFQQKSLLVDTDSALNSNEFPLQIQTSASKQSNSVIVSATTVLRFSAPVWGGREREEEPEGSGGAGLN